MHRIKIILGAIFLIFSSCIDPFYPNLGNHTTAKYVVYGQLTDQEGYKTVSVSMSSTINDPNYNPLPNCKVKIIDNLGKVFDLAETEKGNYQVWMKKEDLTPGHSYQVDVVTESGDEIVSDFDQMPVCPEIDSIYYDRKDIATTDLDNPLQGIQFYIDLDGKNTNSYYYKWELTETWEHHAAYPIVWLWNKRTIIHISPPDSSLFFCWTTKNIQTIYTLSTKDLVQNKYNKYQLHFVDNQTQRLLYCYSLLVNQYAISEPAFKYWDKLRINSNEQGGLYETQPLRIEGNLKCITNPALEVLGFFSATAMRTKRIFVRNVENIELQYPQCEPHEIVLGDLTKEEDEYLTYIEGQGLLLLEHPCVECNFAGGVTVKPDYWPY